MAIKKKKQLPAGKSKAAAVKSAAKRKLATTKSKASTKKIGTATTSSPAGGANNPLQPVSVKAPVSSPDGSLVSPETWQSDLARLQSAADDQDTLDSLNEAETKADSDYTSRTTEATKNAALRKLELARQKDNYEKSKSTDYKNLDANLAYRGATRGSAAERGLKEVATTHANLDNEYKNAESSVDTELNDVKTRAYNEREQIKGFVTKRRGSLAARAAAKNVYSVGSAAKDSGDTAPSLPAESSSYDSTPAPAAPAAAPTAVTPMPTIKKTSTKKKKATSNAAAAKRRIAKKKGKK